MKKAHYIFYSLIISIFTLLSCSTSKQARTYDKTVDGSWILKTVSSEGIKGKVKVDLFNEADFQCFVGSTWTFDTRRSLGTYSIMNDGECVGIKRNFRWTIYEATSSDPKLLQFKRLTDNLKDMDNGDGFRLTIVQLDSKTMQLRSEISFENKPAAFVYNFVKN
ncbi:MAG: hypothetical protein V4556_13890 [Bacteroidota bacterium]